MYKFHWTTSEDDFYLWDEFLCSTRRGHYLQISHWLKSYASYGFKCDLLIARDTNNEIVGGMGMVIGGIFFFKFCSCGCGPIIKEGHEKIFSELVIRFITHAKKYWAICSMINFPVLADKNADIEPYCINIPVNSDLLKSSREGNKINVITSINGFREVKISYGEMLSSEELLFRGFNDNTRRNIRKALKNGLDLHFATTLDEIKEAYALIELNAVHHGYAVRSWDDFGCTLIPMIEGGTCLMPTCKHNGVIKGALIIFDIGKRLTYISGGTLREEIDLKVGHFLHFQMLKLSIKKGYGFYDISVGGTRGVTRFKEGFGGRHVQFIGERYWVHNRPLFWLYNKVLPKLKHKKMIMSQILKLLK
jgi:lipid II:glycine glycyltransferase (peptidoglycan interpeptide bridge formation enzyme)